MSLSGEVQAFITELEAQRNELGARAARNAAKVAMLTRKLEEQDKTIADLRADIARRDSARTAESDW